ncbi:MAG: zinc ribbon domain-containing protein [Muribaculum sp.]|nr:zinc ribbon domain-containing protein [Muribaculum sp.]
MGFNKKVTLNANPSLIPIIANKISEEFMMEGYDVQREDLFNGGCDISVTKGGMFKAMLGMRTALKITLLPNGNLIQFEAGAGIFGQQVVPTMIMLFVTWPVVITQIWGLIKQSQLDDKALEIANRIILENQFASQYGGASGVSTAVDPASARVSAADFCASPTSVPNVQAEATSETVGEINISDLHPVISDIGQSSDRDETVIPTQGTSRMKFCPNCGAKTSENANFCGSCGTKL